MRSILLLSALCIGQTIAKVPLSSLIPICDAKSPDLNACIVKSANLMIGIMSKGIKSYGFPPIDPLFVTQMKIAQGTGPINLNLELYNSTHTGLSTMGFYSALYDSKSQLLMLNATLKDYQLEGQYKAKGKILLLPVVGNGRGIISLSNTGVDFVINAVPKREKGDIYLNLNKFRVYFTFTKCSFYFGNVFGNSKQLDDSINAFLNENSLEVANGFKSTMEDVYSDLYLNLVKKITSKVPYTEIFKNLEF